MTVHRHRVGYSETDQGGIAHHSMYLNWLEQARIEYLREHGVSFRDLEIDHHVTFVVVEIKLNYKRPAKFDDIVEVEVTPLSTTAVSVLFKAQVTRDADLLCTAEMKLACVSTETGSVARLPAQIQSALGV